MLTLAATIQPHSRRTHRVPSSIARLEFDQKFQYLIDLMSILLVFLVVIVGTSPILASEVATTMQGSVLFSSEWRTVAWVDVPVNLILYATLGLFLHLSIFRRSACTRTAWLSVISICALLSVGLEVIQGFLVGRVSSLIDSLSHLVGSAIGAAVAAALSAYREWISGAVMRAIRKQRETSWAIGYGMLLVFAAASPFTLAMDVPRIKRALKAASWIPFQSLDLLEREVAAGKEIGHDLTRARAESHWFRKWSRWGAECASFVLLAWLMRTMLERQYRFSPVASSVMVLWFSAILAVGFSILQMFVQSRGLDATDVVFRWLGTCLGLSADALFRGLTGRDSMLSRSTLRPLAGVATFICGFYCLYNAAIPFQFGERFVEEPVVSAAWRFTFIPAVHNTHLSVFLDDGLTKLLSFAALAACLVKWSPGCLPGSPRSKELTIVCAAIALSCIGELCQIFQPVRVPGLFDVLLAAFGSLIGVTAAQYISALYQVATARKPIQRDKSTLESELPGDRSLMDALLATLAEPASNAPAERMASKERSASTLENR